MSNISNLENNNSALSELSNLESNSPAIKVNPSDYVQIDVNGDGNCFYRALYFALKHHTIPKLLTRFFNCIFAGDEENKPADPEDLEEDEFWLIVRSKLGAEILKEDGILEAQSRSGLAAGGVPETIYDMLKDSAAEEMAARATDEYQDRITVKETAMDNVKKHADTIIELNKLIDEIEDAIKTAAISNSKSTTRRARSSAQNSTTKEYKKLLDESTKDLDKTTKQLRAARLALKKADAALEEYLLDISARWQGHIGNMPTQIRQDPLLGSPESYETMSKAQFKETIVKYLTTAADGSWMYASDFDTNLLRFLMQQCENPIVIDLIPVTNTKYRIRELNSEGIPQVHLVLIQDIMEHYNYAVRGDIYMTQLADEGVVRVIDQQRFRAFYKNTARNAAARGLRKTANRELRAANTTRKNTAKKANSPSPRTKKAILEAINSNTNNQNNLSSLSSLNENAMAAPMPVPEPAPAPAPASASPPAPPKSALKRLLERKATMATSIAAKPAPVAAKPASANNSPAVKSAKKMSSLMTKIPSKRKTTKNHSNH